MNVKGHWMIFLFCHIWYLFLLCHICEVYNVYICDAFVKGKLLLKMSDTSGTTTFITLSLKLLFQNLSERGQMNLREIETKQNQLDRFACPLVTNL